MMTGANSYDRLLFLMPVDVTAHSPRAADYASCCAACQPPKALPLETKIQISC